MKTAKGPATRFNIFTVQAVDSPMKRGAVVTKDGCYRYFLWREWDISLPTCCFIMLNPSIADGTVDDPTIRRCLHFARRENCGKLIVVNLFAWRSTDPKKLLDVDDPVGTDNNQAIVDACAGNLTVCAWGALPPRWWARQQEVEFLLVDNAATRRCLGRTKHGFPRHPLYVKNDVQLVKYPLNLGN